MADVVKIVSPQPVVIKVVKPAPPVVMKVVTKGPQGVKGDKGDIGPQGQQGVADMDSVSLPLDPVLLFENSIA